MRFRGEIGCKMGFQGIRGTGIGPDSCLAAPLRGDFRTRQCDGMARRHLPERGFYGWVGTYGPSCVTLPGFGLGLGPSIRFATLTGRMAHSGIGFPAL